jgi:hypothetical protein
MQAAANKVRGVLNVKLCMLPDTAMYHAYHTLYMQRQQACLQAIALQDLLPQAYPYQPTSLQSRSIQAAP